jgi:hypothetical protein
MLVKSDDGFTKNLWVAGDGYFNDKKRHYVEVEEHEEAVSEMRSQSFDSNESGTQTPDSKELKEMTAGVQCFDDLLEAEGQLVDGSSTAGRKKKNKEKKKPFRTMKEAIVERKLPKKGKTDPNMRAPFQEVRKPVPTLTRIVPAGDDRWALIPEEEYLRQQDNEGLAVQYEEEQVQMIYSPTQDGQQELSEFARDAFEGLGDENLEYGVNHYQGLDLEDNQADVNELEEEEEPFVQPSPRRTARSSYVESPERPSSSEEAFHSARSSPNHNRFGALQDDQDEDDNIPILTLTIPALPDDEDAEQLTPRDATRMNETVAGAEDLAETQTEQREDGHNDPESNVDNLDFRGASSE